MAEEQSWVRKYLPTLGMATGISIAFYILGSVAGPFVAGVSGPILGAAGFALGFAVGIGKN